MSRKLFLVLGLASALVAPGSALAARQTPPPSSATPKDAAPASDAPAPAYTFGGLLGLDQDQTRAKLGPPDLAQAEGLGAMWTYRLNDCALFVFFRSADGQPLAVSGAAAGQRRRGQQVATLEACIAAGLKASAAASRGRGRP